MPVTTEPLMKGVPTAVQSIIKETEDKLYEVLRRRVNVYYSLHVYNINHDTIVRIICEEFKLSWSDIIKRNKEQPVVVARQLYAWLMRNYSGKSTSEIGRRLGNDHATAINSIRKVNDMIKTEDALYTIPLHNIEKKLLHESQGNPSEV